MVASPSIDNGVASGPRPRAGRADPVEEAPTGTLDLGGAHQGLFQRLYEEVIVAARGIVEALRAGTEAPSFEEVQQHLVDRVESLAGDAVYLAPTHEKRVALYVIVGMVDEVFLRAPRLASWPGRDAWTRLPLEQRLFRSHSAGERFFDILDDVLADRTPYSRDLRAVFLTALALGFCGRYADAAEPEAYRIRLAASLGYEPEQGDDDRSRAEAEARADSILFRHEAKAGRPRVVLPSRLRGVAPILIVLGIWLAGGLAVWSVSTARLGDILDAIEATR